MNTESILSNNKVSQLVKDILVLESTHEHRYSQLPFYADGYPGIIFQNAPKGVYLQPANKKLSHFFLYGQTLRPIELTTKGKYRLIVFRLYPYVAKMLFGVDPKELNDDCFDLSSSLESEGAGFMAQLKAADCSAMQAEMIASFLSNRVRITKGNDDQRIPFAVNSIIRNRGNISIQDLRKELHMTARTLERQFLAHTGVTPKQFAKIIQFQSSLNQLTEADYSALTDVVFDNGYADQSHFIKAFKKFTGKTPSEFQST